MAPVTEKMAPGKFFKKEEEFYFFMFLFRGQKNMVLEEKLKASDPNEIRHWYACSLEGKPYRHFPCLPGGENREILLSEWRDRWPLWGTFTVVNRRLDAIDARWACWGPIMSNKVDEYFSTETTVNRMTLEGTCKLIKKRKDIK